MPFGISLTRAFEMGSPSLAVGSKSHARVRRAGGTETVGLFTLTTVTLLERTKAPLAYLAPPAA